MNQQLKRFLWYLYKAVESPRSLQILHRLKESEWYTSEQISELQFTKLTRLLTHCYNSSLFYRNRFRELGAVPQDIKNFQDFASFPFLTKDDLKNHAEDILIENADAKNLKKIYSGGSTGIPSMVYHDQHVREMLDANYVRNLAWMNLHQGSRVAQVWGLHRNNIDYEVSAGYGWKQYLRNFVLLDAFNLNGTKMQQFLDVLNDFKPDYILGYTSALVELSKFIESSRGTLTFRPKAVQVTSESTNEMQRETIERVFETTIYDQYGCTEIMWLAADCSHHNGLHFFDDIRYLEILNISGTSADKGEIVVTDLENFSFPLVRYKLGDLTRRLNIKCGCGRDFTLIDRISGRISDLIRLKDGTKIHGELFTHLFYPYSREIKSFQVVQTKIDELVLKIVPQKEFVCDIGDNLVVEMTKYTRGHMNVRWERVSKIDNDQSGKFHFVKCEVDKETDRSVD